MPVIHTTNIRTNPKQAHKLSRAKISQLAQAYELGHDLPPIVVIRNGDHYVVRDGRHRLAAQCHLGYPYVDAEIKG